MTAMEKALERIGWKPGNGNHGCGVRFETMEDRLIAQERFFEDMGDDERMERV